MLQGDLVYLSAIERSELKQLMDWRNNTEFNKHFREYRQLNSDMQLKWYEEKVMADPSTMMFAVHRTDSGALIGCCGLVYINWVYRHADLSLYIGGNNAYIDGLGYAYESCQLLVDYAFKNLGMNKVWTEIYDFDRKKRQLLERAGFKVDGRLRENYFYNGRFHDSYIYSMLAKERGSSFKRSAAKAR